MTTPDLPQVHLAHFRTLTGSPTVEFDVHFNPESLEYTVANTLKDEGQGAKKKQYVDKTTAKLTMKLLFDTTDTGEDVRVTTDKVAALLKPVPQGSKRVPPNVEFSWGSYRFTGMVEQHKETIDFFAATGVPLRATVDLTLSSQDVQFESGRNPPASVDRNLGAEPVVLPASGGPSALASALGDPRSARAIGAANGSASLRFGADVGLAVSGGVELKAEAAFSAGASAGIGIGGGVGIGGGAGIGAGIGIGGGASIGAAGGASAGFGAAAGGAFAGLRASSGTSLALPGGQSLFTAAALAGPAGAGATFGFGGQVQQQGSSGLGADVGTGADLSVLIRFG